MDKKVVLVSGSSIGLGSSIIEEFAKNNYDVVITYLSHKDEANKLSEELKRKYNTNSLVVKCDIKDEENIKNVLNEIINHFNRLDVLVNNASISNDSLFEDKTKDSFMNILETNLVGTFLMSRVFGDYMYKNNNGQIINISSTNGIDTYYEYSLDYDSSKAGVINLTHNLANHYSPILRVNCICPGWIDTPMNKDMDETFKSNEEKKILLNRFAEPEEIAEFIYKISECTYLNDSILRIDGGVKHE